MPAMPRQKICDRACIVRFRLHLVCLICGKKQKLLRRHLAVDHQLAPDQYRETFVLTSDYPMAAANYASSGPGLR